MNKRETVLSILDSAHKPETIPAAFFLHFDPAYHRGQPAVDKHLEYFRYTDMDFVKIQFELPFPHQLDILKPEDWAKMPFYKTEFYAELLKVVEGLVKSAKKEALVIMTLYSPFMCASSATSHTLVDQSIKENPAQFKKGIETITESLRLFVRGCIRLGIDGFYTSTQGGESGRFEDPASFNECIKPYDLTLMEEINRACIFNILHICDYQLPYADLTRFLDYPGHVVNCSLEMVNGTISANQVSSMFQRPFMGGLNRKGIITTGSQEDVKKEVKKVLQAAPERFILGADCTVPSETLWDNLRAAISAAHAYHPAK
jgi:uroporphyrinogen decarboxylase